MPAKMCSTPVGVMDDFTQVVPPRFTSVSGAQRQSASWTISHLFFAYNTTVLCIVLNACRRHGRFHKRRPGRDEFDGRPVLNACRRHGRFHAVKGVDDFWRNYVLNACRRHGRFHMPPPPAIKNLCLQCSSPVGVMDDFTALPTSVIPRRQRCRSTPVGVMDDFTRIGDSLPCALHRPDVLNACRRHGRFHRHPSDDVSPKRNCITCSTPVGVLDDFTSDAFPVTSG